MNGAVRRIGYLLACCLAATPATAEVMQLATAPESGITVEVSGWAGVSPHNTAGRDVGLVPLSITVTNGSRADRVWTVEPNERFSGGMATLPVVRIAAPAGGSGRATVFADPGQAGSYSNAWLKVRGFGLSGGEQTFQINAWSAASIPSSAGGVTPTVLPSAISAAAVALAKKNGALDRYFIHGGLGLDLAAAPEDWRGWSVFSAVIFTKTEWIDLSAAQRKALVDWLALGGQAAVLVDDASAARLDALGLPATDREGRRRVGAGELVPLEATGDTADPNLFERFLGGRAEHPRSDLLSGYADVSMGTLRWNAGFGALFDVFGPRRLPAPAILAFLAVFGLVAGPINVLFLAGPGHRSRAFWTTPLISLVATGLLLALMVLKDGVGGTGARRVLGILVPTHNSLAIIQEQFSRTGLLPQSSFPIREPSWMRPLGDPEGRTFLEVDGQVRDGDWFRSRSDQAFLIETVRPSRAALEFLTAGTDPPAVISSLDVPLDRVFVIDDDGGFWTAGDVGTGQRRQLEKSDSDAYAAWFDRISADSGPVRRAAAESLRGRRGYAYAESSRPAATAVETLGTIRWIDDRAAFMGPFMRTTGR